MERNYNLCIIKPNKSAFSETFIQEHIKGLWGNKKVIYGGAFPLYDHEDKLLIRSKFDLLIYLLQKRLFKKKDIPVRTKALANFLKRENIDVVFTEYGMVGGLVTNACKEAGVPLVIHFHGADIHHQPTVIKYKNFYDIAFKYASGIIAVSNDMINALVELGAEKEKITYIPCGVDTSVFHPVQIDPQTQNFIAIGRFVEKKSPLSVVKAFQIVLESVPEAELWMVGGGPLWEEVNNFVNKSGLQFKIHLTGVKGQEEIKELFSKMRCFIQHSVTAVNGDKEGSPVTIIEAGASGLPIVSTRHAGIKEAVIDGVTGFLVEEHDIKDMAEKMVKIALSSELAANMGRAGRIHVVENYNIQNQISKLNQVISRALSNN